MYACITEKNGFFDLDGNVSSDDEDDFFEKKIPKSDPADASDALKRKYARHRRYQTNPKVERERNIVKKRYNRMRRAIVKMGGVVDKELTREIFDAIDCKVFKHPDVVYIENVIGDRRMYTNIKSALAQCTEHTVVLAVNGIYVLCESAADCKSMVDKMKELSINGRQLLPIRALTKMMFILQSTNKADISTMKDVLSDHLKVRRRDINASPMPGGESFVVVSSIVGTFAENNSKLNELKSDPPAGTAGIMSLLKSLIVQYSSEAEANYILAEMGPQIPYNYQNGKPIIIINIANNGGTMNVTTVNGDGNKVGDIGCESSTHTTTSEEKVAGNAVAMTWIREHNPANKFIKDYYDAYKQHAGADAMAQAQFNVLVETLGFVKHKKSKQGGRYMWILQDAYDEDEYKKSSFDAAKTWILKYTPQGQNSDTYYEKYCQEAEKDAISVGCFNSIISSLGFKKFKKSGQHGGYVWTMSDENDERLEAVSAAKNWVRNHPPDDAYTQSYYEKYAEYMGDSCMGRNKFGELMKTLGFKKVKKSDHRGRYVWRQ